VAQYRLGGIQMTDRTADVSQRTAAIVAGVGYLVTLIGVVLVSLTMGTLIVPGDAAATANNTMGSEVLFRAGIVGFLIAILGDLLRAWALYVFFKQVNKSLAVFSAWFMLIHDAIFGAALINLFFSSVLFSGADLLTGFEPDQLHALGMLFNDGFNFGFQIGLFLFSFHLGIVGYLAYRSGYVPRVLGVLLIIAGLGYLINSTGKILLPNYPAIIEQVLIAPNVIGELAIVVWLAFRGGKRPAEG
jgi:hypothetical protein